MTITTYALLKTAVADFLNRDDLTSVVPTFIALAEADMQRKVRHWRMEKRATAQLDTQFSAIPSDWVETIRFYLTTGETSRLELISQAELLDRKQAASAVVNRPRYYAMTGAQFELYPVPDDIYTGELLYFAKIPALSDAATTNWLLTDSPDAYLYGALVHSAPYLKDDARIQVWAALYQSAIDNLNAASDSARYSGTGLRMKIRNVS
jgi:hypothetical protein